MKNYFNFNLTGRKLFPIWLLFLLIVIVPYIFAANNLKGLQPNEIQFWLVFAALFLIFIIAYILMFPFAKLAIEGVVYQDQSLVFYGPFLKYIGTILLGSLLSLITLGIYIPWFTRNINRLFIDNSSYNSQNFKFNGEGGKLFVIITLSIVIPVIVIGIILGITVAKYLPAANAADSLTFSLFQQLFTTIVVIPYMYLNYKWLVNIDYKNYTISWDTDFWASCGKIFVEIILAFITIGIYMPMASLRLYKYFAERTTAVSENSKLKFGYDIEPKDDFLFIWGQTLLTIITIGIYFPWAYCKIGSRIAGKTYLEKINLD
jgi:uncharacterized membrane protein YjgN (DUF898 family)